MRAVSTVLDVSLFLLLVGAAVGTLAVADGRVLESADASTGRADDLVERLATSTTRVSYALPAASGGGERDDSLGRRSAHGSYVGLLAEAAVADASVDGAPLAPAGDRFAAALARELAPVLRTHGLDAAVRARWRPYPGAPVTGRVRVGDHPPTDADVRAASVRVASGAGRGRAAAIEAAGAGGVRGVASVLANRTLAALAPERASRVGLRAASPTDRLVAARYARLARALDATGVARPDTDVGPARERLRAALRSRYQRDLRRRYETPERAARAVRVGRVTVVVRTWST